MFNVRFTPDSPTFSQTFLTVENLSPGTSYRLEVYSENGVSSVAREPPRAADILVTTEPASTTSVSAVFIKGRDTNTVSHWAMKVFQNKSGQYLV